MGVSELWPLLKAVGITQVWSGLEGTHAQVVEEVDNKSIAIDLSAWIVQATCQPNLAEAFSDPTSQALIVSFNRVVNYLRYGCLPVCITEGRPPAEKLEKLQQRFKARTGQMGGGGTNHHFSKMGLSIADMLHNMGLPVVQAPGEGEAMCAALNAAGLVDACATFDGDVLLFGAHTVYHTLKLQSNDPQNSEVLKLELAGIQSMLGIEAGGPDALVALSLLCGGDYAVKGAEHVGSRQAIRLVCHLLQDCQNDEEVLDNLSDLVADPPDPEMELLSAQGCTGCKQCKHAGNRKGSIQKHTKHNPCSCCPSDFVQEFQTCEAHPDLPCQCDFHVKEPQRHIDKAVRRIQATPGFTSKAAEAAAAYHKQRQQAVTAVELVRRRYAVPAGQALSWMKRPDVQKVAQQLDWLSEEAVRSKLLPLLMQWDLCHPHQAEVEFVAEGISKVHVQKADKDEDCWRYMLRWRRLPHVNMQLVESDNLWLKKSDSEKRSVKMSLVRQHMPELISKFEQEQRDKLVKKSKGGQRKAAAKAGKPASAPITNYFSQQKHPAAISTGLVRKDGTDVTEHAQPSRPSKGLASMAQPPQAAQNGPAQNHPARNSPAPPESQVQDDLEINLLSPSPAKRRKTPPCSPHLHAAATTAASTPPMDSEQFGFVRLAASRLDGAMHSNPPSDPTSPEGPTLRARDSTAAPDTASTVVYGDIEVPISPADSPVTHPQTDLRQHAISRVGDDLHELRPSPDPLQLSSPAPPHQIGGEETRATVHGRDLQHDGGADLTPVHCIANVQWQSRVGASPIDLVTPSTGVASTVATPTFSESGDLVDLTQT
ncbi:hypothetical protein WJX82_009391 [Trebouxia sp. C0006]